MKYSQGPENGSNGIKPSNGNVKSAVTYKMMAEALFENYESIYDINMKTNEFKTYYQSDFYQGLKQAKEGSDFFRELPAGVERTIAPEDRQHVLKMLQKDTLVEGIEREENYRFVYRIQDGEKKIYHQIRAVFQEASDGMHILMGVKNIDDIIRQRIEEENRAESMRRKKQNYLEVVLATAAAYLEADLTENLVLERSVGHRGGKERQILDIPPISVIPTYDELQSWIVSNIVASNKEDYLRVSDRENLLNGFRKGDRRASVSFSVYATDGSVVPCKAVFYIYQERVDGGIHLFCVIYNLTESQRKEKELKELETELNMSRIRNSTSQMQPHFLYNALGSIQELILIDPEYASELLGDFMIHMRSCVRAMENDEPIPFSEELKNIKAYVNIEKMRLGKRLDMQYDLRAVDFPVLPLSIQPLVENAIRHGVHKRGSEGGTVVLRTAGNQDACIIQVEDTGVGFDVEKIISGSGIGTKDSTGLNNIRFRLEKVMGGTIEIKSKIGQGTSVTVCLPVK